MNQLNMLKVIATFLITISFVSSATEVNGKLAHIEVENGVATFKLENEQQYTSATCAASGSIGIFSITLQEHTGRAQYAALIDASNGDKTLSVGLSSVCEQVAGIESATSIKVIKDSSSNTAFSSGKSLYLYKGDGVTKKGRVVSYDWTTQRIAYVSVEDNTGVKFYSRKASNKVYFTEENCSGSPVATGKGHLFHHKIFDDGRFYMSGEEKSLYLVKSMINGGVCLADEKSYYYYDMEPIEDSECGPSPCIFVEE